NKVDLERSAPPETVTRAALYGGTTTLIDIAFGSPQLSLQESLQKKKDEWQHASYCDYGLHLTLAGQLSDRALGELPEIIQDGCASIKVFTTDITPSRKGRLVDFGDIWEVLQIVA